MADGSTPVVAPASAPPPPWLGVPVEAHGPGPLYTARVDYHGADKLDITRTAAVRGGDPAAALLAPSAGLLQPYLLKRKFGGLTPEDWQTYAAAYRLEMRRSHVVQPDAWARLVDRVAAEGATLVCYCTDPQRCHRRLAAEVLVALGRGRIVDLGERAKCTVDGCPQCRPRRVVH